MKKFYYALCLICIAVTIFLSSCNPNGTEGVSVSISSPTHNQSTQNKLTLDEIKQSYTTTDEKILNTQKYKNYVLVESQAPTIANRFTLYNLQTGDKDILPNGADFIDSTKIIDENNIILYAKGTNSESAYQKFPYEIDCMRGAENSNFDSDFVPLNKNIIFPINKQLSLEGKDKEEVTDIRVTVNGLEVCFGPQSSDDAYFYADYVDCPSIDISYDESARTLTLKFKSTIFAKEFSSFNSKSCTNTFIKLVSLKQNDNVASITISLNESAKYYIGKKDSIDFNIPYLDMQFSENNM